MTSKEEFIEELIEKIKNFQDEIFIPNLVELKISELRKFNVLIAEELSNYKVPILKEGNYLNFKKISEIEYETKLLTYSIENDTITFYPSILREYLKNNL